MAGISSKALNGAVENKKKFQEQEFASKEFNDGSGLDMYEFKWRMHDPQIGRFWQVDPLAEKYMYNSIYAFSENKVTSHIELEGLESESIHRVNNPTLRAMMRENVQKAAEETKKSINNSGQVKVTLGTGVGLKGKVAGATVEVGVNGPQASVAMTAGGKTKGEGSLGGGGIELSIGQVKMKGGATVGSVEVSGDGVRSTALTGGVGAELLASQVKDENGNTNGKLGSNTLGETGIGVKLGVLGVDMKANLVEAGKSVIGVFSTIIEYTKERIKEGMPTFLGGYSTPQPKQ
jgi:RHS repeat-associated protein